MKEQPIQVEEKKSKGKFIVISVIVLIILAVGGWFLYSKLSGDPCGQYEGSLKDDCYYNLGVNNFDSDSGLNYCFKIADSSRKQNCYERASGSSGVSPVQTGLQGASTQYQTSAQSFAQDCTYNYGNNFWGSACDKAIENYQIAVDSTTEALTKSNILIEEITFLLRIPDTYNEGDNLINYNRITPVVNQLISIAPNSEYKCTAYILGGQNGRMHQKYVEARQQFNLALTVCGEEKRDFVEEMISGLP